MPVIFDPTSYWHQRTVGPPNARSKDWIGWLRRSGTFPHLTLLADWSIPVYYPTEGDATFTISPAPGYGEKVVMRIPAGATPTSGSDHALITIDVDRDETFSLWRAAHADGIWTAQGTARYVLSSDGLCKTGDNFGNRGMAPPMKTVLAAEIAAGVIDHRLEVFVPGTAPVAIYPPNCSYEPNRGGIIPEGAVLRIKPGVDLARLKLRKTALVIARAAQEHGLVVGDNGKVTAINCERALIGAGLYAGDLAALTWDRWEFAA